MAERTKAQKRSPDDKPQASPEEPIIPEESPDSESPSEEEPKEVLEPGKNLVDEREPHPVDKPEAAPHRSVTEESTGSHDCRLCLHYPLIMHPSASTLVEDIKAVTNSWRQSYCGKQPKRHGGPLDGKVVNSHINCIGKTFTRAK